MEWPEVNFERSIWTIPKARMKMNKDHEVPLCDRVIEILLALKETRTTETYVFPGTPRKGQNELKPLSSMAMLMTLRRMGYGHITMHGFRSAARDWAGDETPFPREILEHALAHKAGTDVEVSYRRLTALLKRRELMKAWEAYCYPPVGSNVVRLPAGGASGAA
jgi:integrase